MPLQLSEETRARLEAAVNRMTLDERAERSEKMIRCRRQFATQVAKPQQASK